VATNQEESNRPFSPSLAPFSDDVKSPEPGIFAGPSFDPERSGVQVRAEASTISNVPRSVFNNVFG
jgi:hypothetical protein